MKITRSGWVCASLAGMLGVVLSTTPVQATPSNVSSAILAKSAISPIHVVVHGRTLEGDLWGAMLHTEGLTDGYVVNNKFLPGQSTGWHSHPGPSLIFVVAGAVTNYESGTPDCAGEVYTAGSSFIDEGGSDVHMLLNAGSVQAETIAVQLLPSGQPRRLDEPQPANCHL